MIRIRDEYLDNQPKRTKGRRWVGTEVSDQLSTGGMENWREAWGGSIKKDFRIKEEVTQREARIQNHDNQT